MSSVIERFYGEELQAAREQAEKTGEIKGQDKVFTLFKKLYEENRADDAQRATKDEVFRRKLLNEMFPQEANP